MNNSFILPKKNYNTSIRQVKFDNLTVGGESSLAFMHSENSNATKPLVGIEILTNLPSNYPENLKSIWGDCIYNPVEWAKIAVKKGADLLVVRFNIIDLDNIEKKIAKSQEQLEQIMENVDIPIMILGPDRKEIDLQLLPALAKVAKKSCTIGVVTEDTYKDIIPVLKEHNHNVIAKTPIDISLAKQLNILISESGFDLNRVLIDLNTGGLGYGLDYGYSIIERVKLAALEGDNMLNMPIITFVGEEAWKSKEAKSASVPEEWGKLETRALTWECLTATSLLTAGANIVIMYNPDAVSYIKNFINKV